MRTFMALLSGACLVLSGCPLAMEDAYVTRGEVSGWNDAAAYEADSGEPFDSDASADVQVDLQLGLPANVTADATVDTTVDVTADAVDMDAAADTEVEPPACGQPCGNECDELCEPGEPCTSHKDCAGDAECKKNDSDVKVCELDD